MPARREALSVTEVLALPAMVDGWPDAAAACGGISRTTWYELVAKDDAPVPVVRIGRAIKVRRADLLAFLKIQENDDSAGEATPTPSVEHVNESQQIGTRS
ncbi:helix-turn-helix transcriptional regulator [Streptomyces sp. NEAU-Y11]|uniref:helix-turn-helix transcriptional regulator n=1 Tax=Streptomyces cucumeris TaxID=2962890 RepID=UPI0020C8C087|nr:helix-turn-helix domain-containing protein [Streptomyces sp. NEAU-Y11]MCP9209313.1 helix-turn-helix domain-containing protein [Streptomyces sp. NEAU-Y11]